MGSSEMSFGELVGRSLETFSRFHQVRRDCPPTRIPMMCTKWKLEIGIQVMGK